MEIRKRDSGKNGAVILSNSEKELFEQVLSERIRDMADAAKNGDIKKALWAAQSTADLQRELKIYATSYIRYREIWNESICS